MNLHTEKTNRLSEKIRREMLDSLAKSEFGQAIREELVDSITNLSDVKTIDPDIMNGESQRLISEIVGRQQASGHLEEIYKMLIPKKDKIEGFKIHK